MFAFLLSAGILVTLAGFFAIGFGIPNNGFDLGNTLIIAGTSGLGAGLMLIGLAACVRELRRIADALPSRAAARPVRGADPAEPPAASQRGGQNVRIPYPPKAGPETPEREQRPFEPRLAPAPEPLPPAEEPVAERPRPNIFAVARTGGSPEVEEPDPVPLSPARTPAAPIGRTPPPTSEPAYEPKFGPADILARLGGPGRAAAKAEAPRPAPAGERVPERQPVERPSVERQPVERPPEPAPQRQERPRGNVFDTVWPSEGKPARPAGPDTIARVSKPEVKAEPKVEARERAEPAPAAEAREVPPRTAAEARPISILKSGVIDGMAYTLYTDGSIEAQLPQGIMRFASIEELRLHLERHGG